MNSKERIIGYHLIRCIRAPLRALCRARDNYVRSMNCLASHDPSGAGEKAMSHPYISGDSAVSFSSAHLSTGEEDLRELIRVSSQSRVIAASEAVRRSRSVAVGRIDEDAPSDFSGEVRVGESLIFPRSRTCGVDGSRPGVKTLHF